MPSFGNRSKENMKDLHPDLKRLLNESIKRYDFSVIEGLRTYDRQKKLLETGKSLTMKSKHLRHEDGYSHAVDITPYPLDYNDIEAFKDMLLIILETATQLNVPLRIGANWKSFKDYTHIELKRTN